MSSYPDDFDAAGSGDFPTAHQLAWEAAHELLLQLHAEFEEGVDELRAVLPEHEGYAPDDDGLAQMTAAGDRFLAASTRVFALAEALRPPEVPVSGTQAAREAANDRAGAHHPLANDNTAQAQAGEA